MNLSRLLVVAWCCACWSCWPANNARGQDAPSAAAPLMRLLESGRLPPERVGTVVEMICKRGDGRDLQVILQRVVRPDGLPAEVRVKSLEWLRDAVQTRKVRPAGSLAGLETLVVGGEAAQNPALREGAIRLAAACGDQSIAPALAKLALDPQAVPQQRRVAVAGLTAIGNADSRQILEKLATSRESPALRMYATAGLVAGDLPRAAEIAAGILSAGSPKDDPAEMLDAFLQRKNGAESLAGALSKAQLSGDVAKRALRYMYSVGRSDQALSDVLSRAAGIAADAPPPSPEELARLAQDVMSQGDPARGERIFRRQDLNCLKCHSVSRAGGQVGPELSAVGGSSPVDYVLNSILNPNLAIKEQFVTRVFILATGKVLTGIVVDRDETRINIRDANGQLITVPTADVEEEAEGKSLMPQGLTKFLTRQELIDLARFVSELGKPGPYAVQPGRTIQRWRVLRTPPPELTQEVPHLEHLRQHVLGSEPADWDSAYGMVAGVLPLAELTVGAESADGSTRRVLILQGEIQVSAPGAIDWRIHSTVPFQAWVDTESQESKSAFTTPLEPGKHTLTLRIEVGTTENAELRVELRPADNSTVNFEIVGGA